MKIGNKRRGDKGVYVGRPHPLGNPFVIGKDGTREEVIAKYKVWLWNKIKNEDKDIIRALQELRETDTLVCWCDPLPCHVSVIIEAWQHLYVPPGRGG